MVANIKKCMGCNKEIVRPQRILNNWGTKFIDYPDSLWEKKKYCSRKCACNHKARIRNKTNPEKSKETRNRFKKKHPNYEKERRKLPHVIAKRKEYYDNNREYLKKKAKLSYKEKHNFMKNKFLTFWGNKCAFCGYNEHIELLDIHHLEERRGKRYAIWKEIKENKKLIPLCCLCHSGVHRDIIDKKEIEKIWKPHII